MDFNMDNFMEMMSSYNISMLTNLYLNEVLEAFIAYTIYGLLTNSELSLQIIIKNVKVALCIGLLTFILENYNPKYKDTVKNGMMSTLGMQMVKNNISHPV
jgi:hypothetical protein